MGKQEEQHKITIGELEIPQNYFKLAGKKKYQLCTSFLDSLLDYIVTNHLYTQEVNQIDIMKQVIESTICSNVEAENYEISAFLTDCIKIIDAA